MKKRIVALALAVLTLMAVLAGCSTKEKKNENELVIGMTYYQPMNYKDENGKLVGFETEFAQAV